jgi:hypothetical protein
MGHGNIIVWSARERRIGRATDDELMKDGNNQSSATPNSKAANAIKGGGAITPGMSRGSFIGPKSSAMTNHSI